jgi:phosphoglycolate phosphatase
MQRPLLICDLDGTLVDSQPGILEALRQACFTAGIEPLRPLDGTLVGPPLDELLQSVTGLPAGDSLDRLRGAFTDIYDGGACRLTIPFTGVEQMLHAVIARGCGLALATNKRHIPTASILESLGWQSLFGVVETVDSRPPYSRSKARILRDILDASSPAAAAYLGDTAADVTAALEVSLPCILAGWGYGGHVPERTSPIVRHPDEVLIAFAKAVDLRCIEESTADDGQNREH